jgi:hypothetical protein
MSEDAMNKAYWQFAGATLDSAALAAFRAGWAAAMRFMAQPRIPALTLTPALKGPDVIGERYARIACLSCRLTKDLPHADLYPDLWMTLAFADGRVNSYCCVTCLWAHIQKVVAEVEAKRETAQPKEHNPHGLVAFYTDAPNV